MSHERRQLLTSEINAAYVANQCKDFIDEIVKIDENSIIDDSLIERFNILHKNILRLLDTINREANNQNLPEIKNYYHLYFLQQISRFNHILNQTVKIVDKRKKGEVSNANWSGFDKLLQANIHPIEHPLLNQPANMIMQIEVSNQEIFRDAYVEKEHGHQYFYHKRETEKGEKHQDETHYKLANAMIGLPTQMSNVAGKFRSSEIGQATHAYFDKFDRTPHDIEQALFRSAIKNIQSGNILSNDEMIVLEHGKYYRYESPVKFKTYDIEKKSLSNINNKETNHQITHVGHASEYIVVENNIPLRLCIDPIHYQTAIGGDFIGGLLYDRHTDPAFATNGYSGVNIVLISHNHLDHLCERTVKESFAHSNTLFVIPAGDAKYMKEWGITNYIEMSSWNDVLTITLQDEKNHVSSTYQIRAFPANHASCRGPTDFFESLYMGYMIQDVTKDNVILCTGDTAVLEQDHFEQLEKYLIDNDLSISTACIAHGPDRPRQWMECSHQSTADALTMHAKFNVMNSNVYKNKNGIDILTFDDIKESSCYAIGYHQGCYRLGLLSLSDVDTTLLRTFAVLKSFGDTPINEINVNVLNKNVFYRMMDKFEQEGLLNTLAVYNELELRLDYLTANQVVELITSHLNVPQPGYRADFSLETPYQTFEFEYQRLLLNQNPDTNEYQDSLCSPAFEYFCHALDPALYTGEFNKVDLVIAVLNLYLDRPAYNYLKSASRHEAIQEFVDKMNLVRSRNIVITDDQLNTALGNLYSTLFSQHDDVPVNTSFVDNIAELCNYDKPIRDEGHSHTAITMIAGLLHFPDFQQYMECRHKALANTQQAGFFDRYPVLGHVLIGVAIGAVIAACFIPPVAIFMGMSVGVAIGVGIGIIAVCAISQFILGSMMERCVSRQSVKLSPSIRKKHEFSTDNQIEKHLLNHPPKEIQSKGKEHTKPRLIKKHRNDSLIHNSDIFYQQPSSKEDILYTKKSFSLNNSI